MSELPSGWTQVPLAMVGSWGSGGTPTRTNDQYFAKEGIPWLVIGDLNDGVVLKSSNFITELGLANSSAKLVPAGALLVAMYGSIGKLGITGIECATNQAIAFCKPNESIVSLRYLFHAMFNAKPDLLALGQGGAQQNISQSVLKEFEVPLAPKNEQTRISNRLDTLLSQIQSCNDRFDAIPTLLKRFRQEVLDEATSGRLTKAWRESQPDLPNAAALIDALASDFELAGGHVRGNASEPTQEAHDLTAEKLPEGWQISTLRDCCTPSRPITYGILKPGPELEGGIPYIRVADFPGNKLNLIGIRKTSPEIDLQFKRARLIAGDLLLSIRGSVGRLIEIPPELEGANITQDTARLSISKRLVSRYVYFVLLAPDTQRRMAAAVRGVAVRGINIGDVRALQLPVPAHQEQVEIVRRVDALFALADQIEARATAARALAQRLSPLVLAKAFRGELVPQDPDDEPASKLLDRVASTAVVVNKRNLNVSRRKTGTMKYTSTSTREEILKLPHGAYSFDRLRSLIPADYDTLKDAIFFLLNNPSSGLKQVFDEAQSSMVFERSEK